MKPQTTWILTADYTDFKIRLHKLFLLVIGYRLLVILFFIFYFSFFIYSQDMPIVNIPVGKSLSLGNEIAVVNNGVLNTITNPAMLGNIKIPYLLQVNRLMYYAKTNYDLVGISGSDMAQGVVVGLVFGKFSSGNIEIRDIEGVETGETIEYSITTANLGISARLYPNLWLGLGVFGLWEKLNIETKYFGGSAGLMYNHYTKNEILKSLRFGGIVKGVGLNKNLVHNEGISVEIGPTVLVVSYESNTIETKNNKLKLGFNINIVGDEYSKKNICLRFGGSNGTNEYVTSYSGGIGIKFDWFILDYSMNQHNFLGSVQNISLGFTL